MGVWAHRGRVAEAGFLLCAAWIGVRLVPFRRIAPLLGGVQSPSVGANITSMEHGHAACEVRVALATAARRMPWTSTCLMRALAGRLMLGRRGVPSLARIGVSGRPEQGRAHAWLIAAGLDVSGGNTARDCTPIAEFVILETGKPRRSRSRRDYRS